MLIDFPHSLPSNERDPATAESPLSRHLVEHVLPQLPSAMAESFTRAVAKHDFSVMPNRTLNARPKLSKSGVVMIGDSMNMRHPLTGAGMSVALNDINRLRMTA